MQYIVTIAFLLFTTALKAQQVGINNPAPDASVVLDIKSSSKGMLIPRLNKNERIILASPANGLLVYQSGPDSTGFYYFQNGWHYINPDNMLPPGTVVLSKTYPNSNLEQSNFGFAGQLIIPNATVTEVQPVAANVWRPVDSTIAGYPPDGTADLKCIWADSVFFLAGGYTGANTGLPFYKYSPASGRWTMANNNSIMAAGANGARLGNKWIFWGGYAGISAPYGTAQPAYIFDLNSFSLTQSAAVSDSARRFLTATSIGNTIYFWGGINIIGNQYIYGTGYRYDAAANNWSPMSPNGAPSPRYHAGAVAAGTDLVIWGGYNPSTGILQTGAVYHTNTNTWTTMSNTNAPATGTIEPAMAYYNNNVYIISGSETKRYNPSTNSWTTLSPPTFAYSGQKFAYDGNGKLYVWGGARYFAPGAPTNSGYVYDLAANSYSTIPTAASPAARAGHALCVGNGGLLVWGGSSSTNFSPTTAECLASGGSFYLTGENVLVTQPLGALYMYEKK